MRNAIPSLRAPRAASSGAGIPCVASIRAALICAAWACAAAAALPLATATASETKLYKWVDANGVTHWSDRPAAGAKQVDVPAAQGYSAPPATAYPSRPSSGSSGSSAASTGSYQLSVSRPAPDEMFANTSTVAIGGEASPELQPGHTAWLVVDGQRVANGFSATVPAERGSHTVVLQIVDEATGQTIASSSPVTYHVQRRSIQSPPRGPALQPPKKKP